jgi:hypothetical protein
MRIRSLDKLLQKAIGFFAYSAEPETRGMIDEAALRKMKRRILIIWQGIVLTVKRCTGIIRRLDRRRRMD